MVQLDMFKYVTDVNVRSTRNADKSKLSLPGGKKPCKSTQITSLTQVE